MYTHTLMLMYPAVNDRLVAARRPCSLFASSGRSLVSSPQLGLSVAVFAAGGDIVADGGWEVGC